MIDLRRSGWSGLPGAALALALLLAAVGCASRSQQLPDFPRYEAADDFLAMQARLRAYQPPPPSSEYAYTDRNEAIYRQLEAQRRLSQGELELRARQQEELLRRQRLANQQEWNALRGRLARDEAVDAQREEDRARYQERSQQRNQERYQGYRSRLERLAQEQEALARERELYAYRNQQRVAEQVEELKRRQVENLRLQGQPAVGGASGASTQPTTPQ